MLSKRTLQTKSTFRLLGLLLSLLATPQRALAQGEASAFPSGAQNTAPASSAPVSAANGVVAQAQSNQQQPVQATAPSTVLPQSNSQAPTQNAQAGYPVIKSVPKTTPTLHAQNVVSETNPFNTAAQNQGYAVYRAEQPTQNSQNAQNVLHERNPATVKGALTGDLSQKIFDSDLIDHAYVKANALEMLINEKIRKLIQSYPVRADQFRSNVVITVQPKKKDDAPAGDPNMPDIGDLPMAQKNLVFDLNDLVDKYKDEVRQERTANRRVASMHAKARTLGDLQDEVETNSTGPSAAMLETLAEMPSYEVTAASVQVTLSDQLDAEVSDAVLKGLTTAFQPAFGTRLSVLVRQGDVATPEVPLQEWAIDWVKKNITTAIAIAVALVLLGVWLFFSIIRNAFRGIIGVFAAIGSFFATIWRGFNVWRDRRDSKELKKLEIAEKAKAEAAVIAAKNAADAEVTRKAEELSAQEKAKEDELKLTADERNAAAGIIEVEAQITEFVKAHPGAPKNVIRDWVPNEEHYPKLLLMLELLAKRGVPFETAETRLEALRKIREYKRQVSQMGIVEVHQALEDLYWALVSTSYLGEHTGEPGLSFLDQVGDVNLGRLIETETAEAQASVLLSLDEARASRVIANFSAPRRNEILKALSSGKTLDQASVAQMVDRLREVVKTTVASPVTAPASDAGIEALVPLLTKMDFDTQFVTAQSFMALDLGLRKRLMSKYFNVALLPLAREDYLARLFEDREIEWTRGVIAGFDDVFRRRVIAMLPPMQQRMLEGVINVPYGEVMARLKELNQTVLDRLANGEMSNQEIFDLTDRGGDVKNNVVRMSA